MKGKILVFSNFSKEKFQFFLKEEAVANNKPVLIITFLPLEHGTNIIKINYST